MSHPELVVYLRLGTEMPAVEAQGGDMRLTLHPKPEADESVLVVEWQMHRLYWSVRRDGEAELQPDGDPWASGYTKWDGCVIFSVLWHVCGEEDMDELACALRRVHEMCRRVMPEADY